MLKYLFKKHKAKIINKEPSNLYDTYKKEDIYFIGNKTDDIKYNCNIYNNGYTKR
jgi:hypothetical protein